MSLLQELLATEVERPMDKLRAAAAELQQELAAEERKDLAPQASNHLVTAHLPYSPTYGYRWLVLRVHNSDTVQIALFGRQVPTNYSTTDPTGVLETIGIRDDDDVLLALRTYAQTLDVYLGSGQRV